MSNGNAIWTDWWQFRHCSLSSCSFQDHLHSFLHKFCIPCYISSCNRFHLHFSCKICIQPINILVKSSIIIYHKITFLSVQSLHLAHPSQLGSVLQYSHFSQRLSRNPPSSALETITMTANTAPKRTRYLFIMVCNQISSWTLVNMHTRTMIFYNSEEEDRIFLNSIRPHPHSSNHNLFPTYALQYAVCNWLVLGSNGQDQVPETRISEAFYTQCSTTFPLESVTESDFLFPFNC